MEYKFSDKVKNLQPSAIREMFKYANVEGMISLSSGSPSNDAFPLDVLKELSNKIIDANPFAIFQYGITEGYEPLRKLLMERLKTKHKNNYENEDILITSGAQQGIDLITKALCNEGDIVICEQPSFIGAINTFKSYNTKLCGVEMEQDGINTDKLEQILKTNDNVKLLYTIPNFQNPSGITMSFEKRKKVYELAKKYGVLIIEDDPYGELRFKGENVPPIKSLDTDGVVAYVGSFSKILSPGIRVGYTLADKKLIQKIAVCKQGSDVHTNIWAQMLAYEFMKKEDFPKHLQKLREMYSERFEYVEGLINKHLVPKGIKSTQPEGGLFIWLKLPNGIDVTDFCRKAIENKVCVVPGTTFLINPKEKCSYFRINFSFPSKENLKKAIENLSKIEL